MDAVSRFESLVGWLQSNDAVQVQRAHAQLRAEHAAHPDDAHVQYLIASTYDSAGYEADAWPHYERALAIGVSQLPEHRRPEIFVQAGSTLRNLGRVAEARALFDSGRRQYPAFRALRVFQALLEADAGEDSRAMLLLFEALSMDEEGSLSRYRRSLRSYIGDLLAQRRSSA